ncbi:MAG TPA: hypothetical protein ENI62_14380, partial [Gammaproteobacteria bacterium]|nr:hypothetical protein [Gammaproteobacteria bacterium]
MRTKRTPQVSIFDPFAQHEIGRELAAMSAWLDAHLEVLDGVAKDSEGAIGKGHRATRDDRGIGLALCVAQTTPPAQLRRAGLSSA